MELTRISFITQPTDTQLEDYFQIRHQGFREVMHWTSFSGAADKFDREAKFVLALSENEVIGGVRMVLHHRDSDTGLAVEDEHFNLSSSFPEFELSEQSYFEAGRLVLAKPFRDHVILTDLVQHVIGFGQRLECRYLFAASPKPQARYYRQILHSLGVLFTIRPTPLRDKPLYEGTLHYLGYSDLNAAPDYRHVVFADS
jgi:hypothetical protein